MIDQENMQILSALKPRSIIGIDFVIFTRISSLFISIKRTINNLIRKFRDQDDILWIFFQIIFTIYRKF